MGSKRNLVLIFSSILIMSLASQTLASGVFEINLSSLVDSLGRDLRFDCCAWQNNTTANNRQQLHHSHNNLHNHFTKQHHHQPCDPNKCQLIVRICVKNYQTQIDPSQCTFGELSAQVMRPNEPIPYVHYPQYAQRVQQTLNPINTSNRRSLQQVTQSQQLTNAANIHLQRMLNQQLHQTPYVSAPAAASSDQQQQQQQPATTHYQHILSSGQSRALRTIAFNEPITFPFNFTWPGTFSLIIDAWYESPTGLQQVPLPFASVAARDLASVNLQSTTYDLYKKQLIIKHSMHGWLAVKNDWTYDVHKTDTATLTYSYRVTCQQNYFGEQCNILCRPRDDVYGHYTCSSQGNIVCLPGWSGSYCLNPICTPGCHREQGNCSRPNECNCRAGWEGPLCDQCVRHHGCVHGYCNRPNECICEEGWGGLLCHEDLRFCAHHQPCKNGALCTNIFDPNGIGSYKCNCEEGFTGKNCERRINQDELGVQDSQHLNFSGSLNVTQKHPVETNQVIPVASSKPQPSKPAISLHPHPLTSSGLLQHPNVPLWPPGANLIQPITQHQTLDHGVIAAYGTIIVCMLILVVLFLLRIFFERSTQRQYNQDSTHVEDVATMQNHQNIYKSRTSLTTDKTPYDTVDSSSGCSSGSSSNGGSNGNMASNHHQNTHHQYHRHLAHYLDSHDRRIYGAHHLSQPNLTATSAAATTSNTSRPLNPPPPYTASQSQPNSTYASNSIYNTSIYNHPGTVSTIGCSSKTNSTTTSSLYTTGPSATSPYGVNANPASRAASMAANPYGGSMHSAYQAPATYVIYLPRDDLYNIS